MAYLYDDLWIVKMTSEYALMFASSWVDIMSRSVFTIGLLAGIQSAKQLLELPRTRSVHPITASANKQTRSTTVARLQSSKPAPSWRSSLRQVRWSRLIHSLFAVWGLVITAFHFHAEIRSFNNSSSSCPIVLRPWLGSAAIPCPLLIADCQEAGISGYESEVQALWRHIEVTQVLRLVSRHCSSLEIPSSIQQFHGLKTLKVYNSTIIRWEEASSALTLESHPLLRSLQLIRTNFTKAKLPTGLWSSKFPQDVTVIEFCVTNLIELPLLVASIWPQQLRLAWEGSSLANVPSLLYDLNLNQLSLARNALTSIPGRLLEVPSLMTLSVAHTSITSLPSNVSLSAMLEQLSIAGDVVSEMPSWFYDDLLLRPGLWLSENHVLFAGESPYCDTFPTRTFENSWRIVCETTFDEISYPLDLEDAQSASTNQI